MVAQNVFHMGSSHQITDLECFTDRYSIPWNLPTIFHPDLIATIPQTYLLSLCALLSPQSHLFPICVVSTYNDSRKDLHKPCQIPRDCQSKWLYASYSAPRTFASSFRFPENFCFARIRLDPLGWPSIAPRLHIDDCFEIHNLHWELCDLLLSCHQNFGSLADLAISVFREMSINTVFTKSTLLIGSKDGSWEELACESLCSGTLSPTRFSLNSCSHSGMSEWHGSSRTCSWFSFLFGFGILVGLFNNPSDVFRRIRSPSTCLSHFHLTRLLDGDPAPEYGSPRTCESTLSLDTVEGVMGGEVDELEEELSDKPGTTIGTKFSVFHRIRTPFLMRCGFLTVDPLIWVSMFIAKLSKRQYC